MIATDDVRQVAHGLLLPSIAPCFDLAQTLDCGQAFRWAAQPDGSYRGVVMGQKLSLVRLGADILLQDTTLADYDRVWRRYFDLDRDYAALKTGFSADPVLQEAITYAPGIRVLWQEPWETVCTFIISANNNIPRIKGIVERLAALLGEPLGDGLFAFPTPQRLAEATPEDLAPLRCGYRAAFLLDAATKFASGQVTAPAVAALPTPQAAALLMSIKGVGPKVADCTLLFGFGRAECFPMDTWMKKVMAVLYPGGLPQKLLPVAGLAQQYLFHYARNHKELF